MKTYLEVIFWISIVSLVLRVFCIAVSDYPRIETHSLGFDIAMFIISVPFFIWVVYLRSTL